MRDHDPSLIFDHNWAGSPPEKKIAARPFDRGDDTSLRWPGAPQEICPVPAAGLSERQRFDWLEAPRNTVVQPGLVPSGLTGDLLITLVMPAHHRASASEHNH